MKPAPTFQNNRDRLVYLLAEYKLLIGGMLVGAAVLFAYYQPQLPTLPTWIPAIAVGWLVLAIPCYLVGAKIARWLRRRNWVEVHHVNAVEDTTEKYYRDVYDHVVQLVELNETYRDLVTGARDIYLNSLSMSTNEVMKTLTVVATIVLPLTFVAGVYGMNFETMPELSWPHAYYTVMLGMAGIAGVMVLYFRREGWL